MTGPLIIGHRGASALAPENTLAAFQKAIDDGAEGLEFDVRLAKDGVPVVFHDGNLKRIVGFDGIVSNFTAEELQKFDAGSWFDQDFSTETIPTLPVLLDFLNNYDGALYVEMKCAAGEIAALARAVCRIVEKSKFLPQIKLKSFNLRAIAEAKKILPRIKTVALFQPRFGTLLRGKSHRLKAAETHRADEISLHYSLATQKMIIQAKSKNFPVTIWTVDNPAWIRRAIDLEIGAVITNDPARLLAKRREILQKTAHFDEV